MKRSMWRGLGVVAAIMVLIPIVACGGKLDATSCDPRVDDCTPAAPPGTGGGWTTRCDPPVSCGSGTTVKFCRASDSAGTCHRATYVLSDARTFDCASCGDCSAAYSRAYASACDGPPEPIDASVPPPPPPVDAGPPPGTCAPADMSGFTPVRHPPARVAGACTQTQIDTYLKCLTDSSTSPSSPACTQMSQPENAGCVACILTPGTNAAYGPLIQTAGYIELNVPGCVSLAANEGSAGGCGDVMQAESECVHNACVSCPVSDNASFEAEQACESDAASTGACAAYATKAQCVNNLPAASKCTGGTSFEELFAAIVPLFCM